MRFSVLFHFISYIELKTKGSDRVEYALIRLVSSECRFNHILISEAQRITDRDADIDIYIANAFLTTIHDKTILSVLILYLMF